MHAAQGTLEGVPKDGVTSFKGIPYAAPPTGRLRWRPPEPAAAWRAVRRADAFAPPCAQGDGEDRPASSEDCLYLNLWTAAPSAHERRAVMVWIHGGGFTGGASSEPAFDGTRLAQAGVVLVSVGHRLGVFGFMAHPQLDRESGATSGNYGLRDVIAALHWVRANIASFGGDPHRVTLFGQSAGGIAVSLLAAAPAAAGLFERLISESGGAFMAPRDSLESNDQSGPLQTRQLAESIGARLLRELGAADISAARAMPASTLLKAATHSRLGFWPVIDGEFLPAPTEARYRSGDFNDTPILIGTNSDEGHGTAPPGVTAAMLHDAARGAACPQDAEALLSLYPLQSDADAARAFEMLHRDGGFAWNTWTWARWQARKGRGRVFLYYYDYPLARFPNGAPHWAEVPFVFGNYGWWDEQHMPLRPEDLAASDLIRHYCVNFALRGDPNAAQLPSWPAFSEATQTALVFGRTPAAQPLPNLERLRAVDRWYSCAWGRAGPQAAATPHSAPAGAWPIDSRP